MAQIQWSSEYETGNEKVDAQHQHLVEIVNKFETALDKGKGRQVMGEILRELVGYTQEHFTFEEEVMSAAGYEGLKLHKAQHRQLLQKVERYQFEFSQGKRLSRTVHDFLNYWLMNHIKIDDLAFAASLAGGTEATAEDATGEEVPAG